MTLGRSARLRRVECEYCRERPATFSVRVFRPGRIDYVSYACSEPQCRVKAGLTVAVDTQTKAAEWKIEFERRGFSVCRGHH